MIKKKNPETFTVKYQVENFIDLICKKNTQPNFFPLILLLDLKGLCMK